MKKNIVKYNSKALNLEAIKNSDKNVTLGFKCEPDLKLLLANEAHEAGLTLSLYVKNLVASHRATLNEITEQSKEILQEVLEKNRTLIKKINFYENDTLRNLFLKNRNQIIEFKNTNGEMVSLKVLEIGDIYTIIINTFKHKK